MLQIGPSHFDVGHHFDVFAVAPEIDRASLNLVDFVDHFFVTVPLKFGLRIVKTGGGRVHFFQDCVQVPGVGRLCLGRSTNANQHAAGGNVEDEGEPNHSRILFEPLFFRIVIRIPCRLLSLGQNFVTLNFAFAVRNRLVTHDRNRP